MKEITQYLECEDKKWVLFLLDVNQKVFERIFVITFSTILKILQKFHERHIPFLIFSFTKTISLKHFKIFYSPFSFIKIIFVLLCTHLK